jgi:hypothetical protein
METLPSGLPNLIGDEEDLARFLTQSNQFHVATATVKPSAFLPSQKDKETSVCRHGHQPSDRLWTIGRESTRGRGFYGAAIFKAEAVREANLKLRADEPPARHAVIHEWPWLNDPELQKAQQKEKALVLVSRSNLFLMPA